ncbi:unnamed protein product [Fusarium equiseti]|uniref:Clock-controlled protein 6 n=1 Tax=Fusarium equiseti TaxID=61235 RepID=A0A8J2IQH1_FUSEQ|nr:unnamed protein product [Fusarium equiseti]
MKFYVAASLAFLSGAYAAESASTTVTCSSCPSAVTTPDIVTRSDPPKVSCTGKPLMVVSNTESGSGAAMPTGSGAGSGPASTPGAQVPVSGAAGNKVGGAGMAIAAAVAAVYML